ncbi:MAG: hypothetical protein FWD76_00440 [Firmicutes bacterium]|nr:hypothetical protein [Bacillota bacterium]
MKQRIHEDLFDIAKRLQEIDPTYFVVYDKLLQRYEVHSSEQRGNSLCFVVPYASLDVRTLHYANQTRAQNLQKLLLQMEQNNQKLAEQENELIIQNALQKTEQALYEHKGG